MLLTNKYSILFGALFSALIIMPALAADEQFQGVIGKTAKSSTPWWPPEVQPPADAPNILIWMIDDVGFGQIANFGGLVETPNLDTIANSGLRYTNFHATALCSPTRASTLTGRNHHAVGMGAHANTPSGYPGYNARVPKSAATVARILKDRGYATYAVGKWDHLPTEHAMPTGPFDYWPSGQGFEHFYGFIAYDNHHFTPTMWRDHSPVEVDLDNPEYHLTTDLADQAIDWIRLQQSARPAQPFFMYWATGAVHGPHHAPQAYIEKYRGKFDQGWNKARAFILERQKKMGLVPVDAQLPDWPEGVPTWDSLSAEEQKMAARAMEVFAAMLDHADYEFGRIIEALKQTGELDNTIIIAVSDNGTSAEGGLAGSFNELLMGQVDWAENLQHFDNWGGPDTYPHYPVGWAAAGNTPFRYYKQSAHEGGTRVPMLMSWPKGIARQGELRNQFHHVNDIVPTLLDLIGIAPPEEVDGVKQQPMDGISFRYTFDDERVATRKQVQYFELWGNHGIWADGWKAEVLARDKPWDVFTRVDYENPVWELYHVAEDFNERINVAEKYPEKLKELQKLFEQQAIKNNVYPIGPDFMQEKIAFMQKVLRDNNGRFNYYEGTARINNEQAPPINLMPFTLAATLATSDKRDGVIFALGGAEGGFALYIKDNKPAFAYNFLGRGVTTIASDDALPDGAVEITLSLDRQSPTAGNVVIGINGKNVAQGLLENLGTRFPTHETLDIGHDSGSHVSKDYRDSAVMAKGVINQVDFQMVQP